MSSIINASVSSNGIVSTADASGILKVQSNGSTTNALAWIRFNGGATPTIAASYNVTSVTYNAAGDYTITFTNALTDANYCITGTCSTYSNTFSGFMCPNRNSSTGAFVAPTTTTFRINTMYQASNAAADSNNPVYVAIFGN